MNLLGSTHIHCHVCNRNLDISVPEVWFFGDDVMCYYCEAHLGYWWDLIGILWNQVD